MRPGKFSSMSWLAAAVFAVLGCNVPAQTPSKQTEYDLVVVGGTPGGFACAVRAAREGLKVALVNRHSHLGGILSSGLGVWDTQWEGRRAPNYDEVRASLFEHYR